MRLRLGLWAGGAALLALPVGWAVATASYDPLVHGTGTTGFGVLGPDGVLVAGGDPLTGDRRVTAPAVGSRLGLVLGLQNDGRFAVEVLDVGLPYPGTYLDQEQAFAGYPAREDLAPFRLGRGEARDVGTTFRVAGCPDGPGARSAGALVAQEVPVTWRWLGRTRTTTVRLQDFRPALDGLPVCAPG